MSIQIYNCSLSCFRGPFGFPLGFLTKGKGGCPGNEVETLYSSLCSFDLPAQVSNAYSAKESARACHKTLQYFLAVQQIEACVHFVFFVPIFMRARTIWKRKRLLFPTWHWYNSVIKQTVLLLRLLERDLSHMV